MISLSLSLCCFFCILRHNRILFKHPDVQSVSMSYYQLVHSQWNIITHTVLVDQCGLWIAHSWEWENERNFLYLHYSSLFFIYKIENVNKKDSSSHISQRCKTVDDDVVYNLSLSEICSLLLSLDLISNNIYNVIHSMQFYWLSNEAARSIIKSW